MAGSNDLAGLPKPTAEQTEAFVDFVCRDHSWWKHLPSFGRGEPFVLHLHPGAHMVAVEREDGSTAYRAVVRITDRRIPEFFIDYKSGDLVGDLTIPGRSVSHIDTATYRSRYGYWSYWNSKQRKEPTEASIARASEALDLDEDLVTLGMVYLRASVSGRINPYRRKRWLELERAGGHTVREDERRQRAAMFAAMHAVCSRIWPEPD